MSDGFGRYNLLRHSFVAELSLRLQERMGRQPSLVVGHGEEEEKVVAVDVNQNISLGFIREAQVLRPPDTALQNDIRYLWWALSEIRSLTKEHMEVLDCSSWGDALFATLMATRMMPVEAHYLYDKSKHHQALAFSKYRGADCVTVPILDGRIPECNVYDVIILDAMLWGPRKAASMLKKLLSLSMWRFTRIFVRNGNTKEFGSVYNSMKKTMEWGVIPHTSIIHGCMSESWREIILKPQS